MSKLLLLFIVVPAVELLLLIQIGKVVGLLPTLALIVFTGSLGAYLARRQGLGILDRVKSEMNSGQLPAGQLVDGVIVLIAGAVLMTPGILTDVFGFFCLIPAGRGWIKTRLQGWFERSVKSGNVVMQADIGGGAVRRRTVVLDDAVVGKPEIKDVTPAAERIED